MSLVRPPSTGLGHANIERSTLPSGRRPPVDRRLLLVENRNYSAGLEIREGLKIFECTAGGLVDVAGISTGSKCFHKAAPKRSCVELALFGERFEQNQRAVAVVGLVSGLFSEVIMTVLGSFKSVDATGIKLLEFGEIVDPVRTQSRGVSDKLAPHGSAEPSSGDILECVNPIIGVKL